MGAEVAVEDAGAVARAERERTANRHGFLAAAVVVAARHLALAIQGERPLLGGAHEEHEAQEARPVVTVQGIGRSCRARLRVDERRGSRGGRSHLFSLFGATGSPPQSDSSSVRCTGSPRGTRLVAHGTCPTGRAPLLDTRTMLGMRTAGGFWARRLGWRLIGAWRWPLYVAVTLLDALIVNWLPPNGTEALFVPALVICW